MSNKITFSFQLSAELAFGLTADLLSFGIAVKASGMGLTLKAKIAAKRLLKRLHLSGDEFKLLPYNGSHPAVNNTINRIMALNPRVTHPSEYMTLATLAATTQYHILEVGCYLGYSSCIMASALSGQRKVVAVDMFDRQKGWKMDTTDDWIFKQYSQWDWAHKTANELGLGERIQFIKNTSAGYFEEISKSERREKYDLLFIDGDHSYEACKADLKSYAQLLEKGGYIAMHDYLAPKYPGVKKAVEEFLESNKDYTIILLVQSMVIIHRQ